jgi:hypothetical protein
VPLARPGLRTRRSHRRDRSASDPAASGTRAARASSRTDPRLRGHRGDPG